jgi:hypothetical protein
MSELPAVAGRPALKLFGGAVVQSDDTPMGGPAAHRHRIALLAILAVSARPLSRDKLIAYLWPERDTEKARNLLKTALHELRKALGERVIITTGDLLSIDPTQITCDVTDFEAAIRAGDLKVARGLYTGPFLDGFFIRESTEFEDWSSAERLRLERLYEKVIERVGDSAEIPVPASPTSPVSSADRAASLTPVSRSSSRRWAVLSAATIVLAMVVTGAVFSRRKVTQGPLPASIAHPNDVDPGTALAFDGRISRATTPTGTAVTTQTDNVAVDMWLDYAGASAEKLQVIYYNGDPSLSGWGLLVLGPPDGQSDGTLAVMAGGITVKATPLVLKKNRWQHVAAERRDGKVTVTLDDSSYALGDVSVTPMGARFKDSERTSLGSEGPLEKQDGNAFNGMIDRLRIRNLAAGYWWDRWYFDEGKGSAATGYKGSVLDLRAVKWVPSAQLAPRDIFWSRLESSCDEAFAGTLTAAPRGDTVYSRAPLILFAYKCAPTEIRLALYVGADHSRLIVVNRVAGGLSLTQRLSNENGSPAPGSGEAGVTRDAGDPGKQIFLGPNGKEWQIEIEPGKRLTYIARQGARDSVRIEFPLDRQVASPPPPWGR